jgi:hypothetical protein
VLSINDKPEGEDAFVERFVRDVSRDVTLSYEGVIFVTPDLSYKQFLADRKSDRAVVLKGCQPLWVWRKVCSNVNM